RRGQPSDLHPSDPRADLTDAQLDDAAALVARLAPALAPLEGQTCAPFAKIAALHRSVVAALSADETGVQAAFQCRDGTKLESACGEVAANASHADFAVEAVDYADLFRMAISGPAVWRPPLSGVRLRIYGPLEARLQSADRIVLGALIEGTWPPEIA